MILLALLCLSLSYYAFTLPTPASNPPTDTLSSFFIRDADNSNTRTMFSILWRCLSTIFTCTWIAIHPNIPGPKENSFRKKVVIMVYLIIMPEIMILCAARQYRAARHLAEKYKAQGWTMAHTFFLIMGGFTLHDNEGTALRILEYSELETLFETGKISWPSITKEEIQDRSQSDYLSKGIVFLHLMGFITQSIARCAYDLLITKLEGLTFSYATYAGLTYYLWLHKPLDVACSLAVPVYLLEKEGVISENIPSSAPGINPESDLAHSGTSFEPTEGLESTQTHIASQFPINEESQLLLVQPLIVSELDPDQSPPGPNPSNAVALLSHNNSTATSDPNLFAFEMHQSTDSMQKKHWISEFISRFSHFFGLTRIDVMILPSKLDHSVPLCLPTFYCPEVDDIRTNWRFLTYLVFGISITSYLSLFVILLGIQFNASAGAKGYVILTPEIYTWNFSVAILVLSQISFSIFFLHYLTGKANTMIVLVLMHIVLTIQTFARITVFILASLQLRELTTSYPILLDEIPGKFGKYINLI